MTPINLDAFASGQLGSKIWLCDKLEDQLDGPKTIRRLHILGGWYGVLPMLLVSRGRVSIEQVTCIDVDAEALRVARKMNDYFNWKTDSYSSVVMDVCTDQFIEYAQANIGAQDVVINSSCEHMSSSPWFSSLAGTGAMVVLQSCNMDHKDHIAKVSHINDFKKQYPISDLKFEGEIFFDYRGPTSFTRYMLIGRC